jgi:hypothetical protein
MQGKCRGEEQRATIEEETEASEEERRVRISCRS